MKDTLHLEFVSGLHKRPLAKFGLDGFEVMNPGQTNGIVRLYLHLDVGVGERRKPPGN